ncbi:MAG: serine/threonine-protein phosphatase [Bacteroidetes bacterium]|nr:serine/threonine-protein phosphatase [Bacteroidota bacterium]
MNVSNIYYLHEIGGKKNQEDYIWPPGGTATGSDKIFIVSDGVGGAENGELASRLISECMGAALLETPARNLNIDVINAMLKTAQHKLVDYARIRHLNDDMATTFSLLVLNGSKAFISWCGDSRVYHIRNGNILYKTSDHSLVNTLVKNGEITEAEAAKHPQKNIILKAIRADYSAIEAEAVWINDIENGDYFLLCTDGLLENISDSELESLVTLADTGNDAIIEAFQQYCLNKTRDNYSMYLVRAQINDKRKSRRKKILIGSLVTLFFALLGTGAYYYLNYSGFSKENNISPVPGETILPSDNGTSDTDKTSLLPDYEIIEQPVKKDSGNMEIPTFSITKADKDSLRNNSAGKKIINQVKENRDTGENITGEEKKEHK